MQHLLLVEFKVFFFSFFLIFPQKIGDSLSSWQRKRREAARSWSDVDVWRSLFHSPLPVDEEEEEEDEEEEEEEAVTGPARSLCAAVTSTGRPPRELRSQYGAEGRAGRTSQLDFSCRQSKHFFSLQNLDFSARRAQSSLIFCGLCWHLTSLSMSRQMSELE